MGSKLMQRSLGFIFLINYIVLIGLAAAAILWGVFH